MLAAENPGDADSAKQRLLQLHDLFFPLGFARAMGLLAHTAAAEACAHAALLELDHQPGRETQDINKLLALYLAAIQRHALLISRTTGGESTTVWPEELRESDAAVAVNTPAAPARQLAELRGQAARALARLSEADRRLLEVAYAGRVTEQQLAQQLDLTLPVLRVRLRVALQNLRAALALSE